MPKYKVSFMKIESYMVEADNPYDAEDMALEMLQDDELAFLHEPIDEIEVEEVNIDTTKKWQPALYEIPVCPKCDSRLKQEWKEDRDIDWGPTADPYCVGLRCPQCDILYTDLDKVERKIIEDYHPYSIYLQGYMSNEEYKWFKDNGIEDVRKCQEVK